VWVNYLNNDAKYGGRSEENVPPQILVGCDAPANGIVRCWVQDNGPGIPSEQQTQLFTQFTRLHQTKVEGHGLGLSIVQRIVTRLGGQVGVESQVGQGSLFYFTLPVDPETTLDNE
jgi:signal transduction histidine kinase